MTLKANVSRDVPAADVASRMSREFRRFIDPAELTRGPYTVIAFPGMRGEVSPLLIPRRSKKHFASAAPVTSKSSRSLTDARA